MMLLSDICGAVNGQLIGADVCADGISINTRQDCEGRLFVALKGDNFDAHDYTQQAKDAGAVALMVERHVDTQLPVILVQNTHKALKDLAAWWRSQFDIPILAITGSVGKTTVKEMLGAIVAEVGSSVVTEGNLNNEIGVPLTLMQLCKDDHYAVVEMGMNQAGEIGRLSHIAKPNVALVNNAGAAHLEGLGTVEAVAYAKGEIFSGLAEDGIAVINADDRYAQVWHNLIGDKQKRTFGLTNNADVTATYESDGAFLTVNVNAMGEHETIRLNSMGRHNVMNALAAITAALAANIPMRIIVQGLEQYQPVKGRLNPIQLDDFLLFDDTYNANPVSMQAAIKVLSEFNNTALIVGDMAELGDACEAEHVAIGKFAAANGIDTLLACGEYAHLVVNGFNNVAAIGGAAYQNQEELLRAIERQPLTASVILVKGSRSAKMERVVNALKQANISPNPLHNNKDKNATRGEH